MTPEQLARVHARLREGHERLRARVHWPSEVEFTSRVVRVIALAPEGEVPDAPEYEVRLRVGELDLHVIALGSTVEQAIARLDVLLNSEVGGVLIDRTPRLHRPRVRVRWPLTLSLVALALALWSAWYSWSRGPRATDDCLWRLHDEDCHFLFPEEAEQVLPWR